MPDSLKVVKSMGAKKPKELVINEVRVQIPTPIITKQVVVPAHVEPLDNVEQQINDHLLQNEIITNENVVEEPQEIALRRSQGERKRAISDDYVVYLQESDVDIGINKDPVSFSQAVNCIGSSKWIDAMNDELKSMDKNEVWDLIELTKGCKRVRCK
ncbi:hypothetical protein ACFX2I_041197 [Malus domestica]